MDDTRTLRLRSALTECDAHLARIHRARSLLGQFFPLSADALKNLGDERIEHVDQFVYRFTKLQDAMGTRLFASLYALLEDDESPRPFLDILNRLESFGAVHDVREWQYFRNLRNNIAHEYPESQDVTVATLNALYEGWPRFETLYAGVKHFAEARGLSSLSPARKPSGRSRTGSPGI